MKKIHSGPWTARVFSTIIASILILAGSATFAADKPADAAKGAGKAPSAPSGGAALQAEVMPAKAAAAAAANPSDPIPPEAMQGLDFTGLSERQKELAVAILNGSGCDCGCGMKIAQCRRDDAKCTRSLALGNQVIGLVKQGKSREEIIKTALAPPASKFVQFDIKPGSSPSTGPANAKVTVVSYLDYQCPFCARINPTLEQIVKEYPNDVRLVIKQHPLDFHQNAMIAALGAMAAKEQGKFQEMHRKLFENQSSLSRANIITWAKELGLDVDRFTKDLDNDAIKAKIKAEAKEADDIGAGGTPASFVNGWNTAW